LKVLTEPVVEKKVKIIINKTNIMSDSEQQKQQQQPGCSSEMPTMSTKALRDVQTQHGDASVDEENIVILKDCMSPLPEDWQTIEAVWVFEKDGEPVPLTEEELEVSGCVC
jgi:hypothetical protein